jgi:transposase
MHGISSGQLYTWRKQFRVGELTGFVPVAIASDSGGRVAGPWSGRGTAHGRIRRRGVIESGIALRREAAGEGRGRRSSAAPRIVGAVVIGVPGNVRVYLACGVTDMRRGFDSLAAQVQTMLQFDPHNGALYAFRGKRGDLIKILWWDGQGLCLFAKRLENGRFIWPQAKDGSAALTAAQLSMLLEGIDWRAPVRSWVPEAAC